MVLDSKTLINRQVQITLQVTQRCLVSVYIPSHTVLLEHVDGNGSYYLNATKDYVKHQVELMPESSMKGRNVLSTERAYTSISTSNWLLAQDIASVGMLVSNRVGLPDEVKDAKNRDEFKSSMYWEQDEGNLAF